MEEDRCPVCSKLPLDGPALGIEAPPIKYDLNHDQAAFNAYKGYCCLYKLVRDLHRIWLEKGEGRVQRYFWSCRGRGRLYSVCTDPGNI
jgi:hypothetical protein